MISKEVIEIIRQSWRDLYPHDRGSGRYAGIICPICGSGSGPHGTGITENPKSPGGLHCWKCGFQGDVIDLIRTEQQLDFEGAVLHAAGLLGIAVEQAGNKKIPYRVSEVTTMTEDKNTEILSSDISDNYAVWSAALQEDGSPGADYLERRGISVATAVSMGVGYAAEWRSPKAVSEGKNVPPSPRLIFPKGDMAYATRDIRSDDAMSEQSRKYAKQNHGTGGVFNANVLWDALEDPVIICEGPMDALSAAEAGFSALAVCGTSGRKALTDLLRKSPTDRLLLVALDDDEAGRSASARLTEELLELDVKAVQCAEEVYLGCKDLNEALCRSREQFQALLTAAVEEAVRKQEEQHLKAVQNYKATHATASFLDSFDARMANRREISTGFEKLDNLLGGGLYPGLYILGAISSLGKTTFCLQMMDQIAASGHDVLIFSLEMGRDELIAKSVSRLTCELDEKSERGVPKEALSTLGILSGTRRQLYTARQYQLYNAACRQYRDTVAANHYVFESNGDIGAAQIHEIVSSHIQITGSRPVVLIDYLQILAPTDARSTDKQNTDRAVFCLKALSRDCSIPVIGISSFNRENYTAPVSQASFKESGAIEYSSDILIGLQYEGMDWKSGECEKDRAERLRELRSNNKQRVQQGMPIRIQLKILKNRNGELGDVTFAFNPRYNIYSTC